jgi:hypothetical protein
MATTTQDPRERLDDPTEFFRYGEHPLAELYRERVRQDRDLVILITDSDNDRGTGKTTEAIRLAHGMDRTDDGLTTDKVALDPRPLIEAYTEQPRGSGLVLDESEVGVDKYRAGSAVNRAIRELVSTGRVEQKYLVLNAPADHLVDRDLKTLVDVWFLVERRGFANVYRMGWAPHQGHELTHGYGCIEWDPIPKQSPMQTVYRYLDEKKQERLRGEDGQNFVRQRDVDEMVESAREEGAVETRDELIQAFAELDDLTHGDVAQAADLSRSRISQIVNKNN